MSENLIIFDCDGVLVDSEFILSKVFSQTLASYGYSISVEECIQRFTGVSEHACRQLIMEESGISIPPDYWDLQQPLLMKVMETELTSLLLPVLELLDRMKISKCVASNSLRGHVLKCLECTQQLKYFSEGSIFTSAQVARPKPAPDLFLFAAREMGIQPENCIVIEDSAAGAEAASAAGMQVLMFLGGSHARFDWYRNRMGVHNKPMLSTCHDLSDALQKAIGSRI